MSGLLLIEFESICDELELKSLLITFKKVSIRTGGIPPTIFKFLPIFKTDSELSLYFTNVSIKTKYNFERE